MSKYKLGDKFQVEMVISQVDEDEYEVLFCNEELQEYFVDSNWMTSEDLDRCFDPNWKERQRLAKINHLKAQLEELENEQ